MADKRKPWLDAESNFPEVRRGSRIAPLGTRVYEAVMTLTAVVYPDAEHDWLVAFSPETGTTTQGKTTDEAIASLKEVTELFLEEFPAAINRHPVLTTFEAAVAHA
jgi:predicted RNase H-like HicB family nuclease